MKINVLRLLMNVTRVSLVLSNLVSAADAIDDLNEAARADGNVTPEEDAQIAAEASKMLAPIISEARAVLRDIRSKSV